MGKRNTRPRGNVQRPTIGAPGYSVQPANASPGAVAPPPGVPQTGTSPDEVTAPGWLAWAVPAGSNPSASMLLMGFAGGFLAALVFGASWFVALLAGLLGAVAWVWFAWKFLYHP